MFGRIVRCIVLATILVGAIVLMLYMGIFIFNTLHNAEKRENGNGWAIREIALQEEDTSPLFDEICRMLAAELDDGVLHMNSILADPEEYEIWDAIEQLLEVKKEDLSIEKQLLYDKLMYCSEMYERKKKLPDYSMILSEITGALSAIPEIFYTCSMESKEDVEEYLFLLKKAPGLFRDFYDRLVRQQELGVVYQEDIVEGQRRLCQSLSGESSIFLTEFEEKIRSSTFLTDKEKQRYISENKEIVENNIKAVLTEIEQFLRIVETCKSYRGLCENIMGKQYFDYILELNTGSGMGAEEMFSYLEDKRLALADEIQQRQTANTDFDKEYSFGEILVFLREMTEERFPKASEASWEICQIPNNLGEKMYSAFFTKGVLKNGNYIYISDSMAEKNYLSAYQILAHEAFPGHMYWYNFDRSTEFEEVEQQIKCLGYSEGWAVAAEYAAGEWLQDDVAKEIYRLLIDRKLLDEIFLCQADIGIHAYGWDEESLGEFMQEVYGRNSEAVAKETFRILASNAGAYEAYVIGYYQFLDLKDYCREELQMQEEEFYQVYLEAGQAPFSMIKNYAESLQQ